MVIDTSAIIAILTGEPAGRPLQSRINAASICLIPSTAVFEASLVMTRFVGESRKQALTDFIDRIDGELIPFDATHCWTAYESFLRYGKGRHPAALNICDCMIYAVAKLANLPLLYIGDDFAKTDIRPALV